MRILIIHNHYGNFKTEGEAQVAKAEGELLSSRGHIVSKYSATNAELEKLTLIDKCQSLLRVGWSQDGYERVKAAIEEFRPDLMHVHNYWFRLTPSIFAAAKERGVATVLTLHNYRLVCPAGQFLRKGMPCELCMDGRGSRILVHNCYPDRNWLKSLLAYRLYRETQKRQFLAPLVDAYIALTEFARGKAIEGGLPADKVHLKPNFMFDPLHGQPATMPGMGAIYVGRLSPEKGVMGLLDVWRAIDYPLTIVGDGPQMAEARRAAGSNVTFLGNRSHEDVLQLIEKSAFLVFPSEWYEGFPLSLLESMAIGRAVVATDLGARREMVRDGQTGLLDRSRDAGDLEAKVRRLISDRSLCAAMGAAARKDYLAKYTPETNYRTLMQVYEQVLRTNSRPTPEFVMT
jgi:glycosyltransferase involved in cell wall biosynthesis